MAWTARKGEDLKEHIEDDIALDAHCIQMAEWIRGSKHFVAYTGAGISTGAGIPDFRGPTGVWTLAAKGERPVGGVSTLQAIPTVAHMSLVQLQNVGVMKHLISSNCDGLHVKSGIRPECITEVHGNSNREECQSCGKSYYRDYACHARGNVALAAQLKLTGRAATHFTGRMCICGGPLCDSIINFGENLSEKAIEDGFHHGQQADVLCAMGASLTVSPSNEMVAACKKKRGAKLIIINLQKTPYDDIADLRIFHKTDEVWKRVMAHLGYEVPQFKLTRRVALWHDGDKAIKVLGLAQDNTPATWIKAIMTVDGPKALGKYEMAQNTLQNFVIPEHALVNEKHQLVCFSMGHYNETPLVVPCKSLARHLLPVVLRCTYTPSQGTWEHEVEAGATESLDHLFSLIGEKKRAPVAVPAQGGFAVYPKLDCPHVAHLTLDHLVVDARAVCKAVGCGDATENWLCLTCGTVACSRYVKGHMAEHGVAEPTHRVVASFSDLSFWCYGCDSYVDAPSLQAVKKAMELSKFVEQ